MEHSQFEAQMEVDEVTNELNRELRNMIESRFGDTRKSFRLQKKRVVKMLRELIHDIESLSFKG